MAFLCSDAAFKVFMAPTNFTSWILGFHICPYAIRNRHFCYYSIYLDTYGISDFILLNLVWK